MKKYFVLLAMLPCFSSLYAKHYGAAGCGLGSLVVGPTGNQVIAATTNGTSYSQTLGISSGTSNCVDHDKKVALAPYIENNREQLLTEMAKGRGESLVGLAHLMGCADQASFDAYLQKHMPRVDGEDLTGYIFQLVKQDSSLNCSIFL